MKFEWDPQKEKANLQKHGVSFEQAAYVFADPFALNKFDNEHSKGEDRWMLLGAALNQTVLVVVHTFRDKDGVELVRIISARRATAREKQTYKKRLPI
ncbi:MAG: BrnT family toxin [Desulfococcaceae bacterium]